MLQSLELITTVIRNSTEYQYVLQRIWIYYPLLQTAWPFWTLLIPAEEYLEYLGMISTRSNFYLPFFTGNFYNH